MDDSHALPWTTENLDLSHVDLKRVRHNEDLFFLICAASFMKSGSELYTQNLVNHFADDQILQTWLSQRWEHDELQHGRALAVYVRHVWPEFDWENGFNAFWTQYSALCTHPRLEASRGLELAARCVVETGTVSLYRALNEIAEEPVLKQLTRYIKHDEVRHYKFFYKHFQFYRAHEGLGRYRIFRTLLRRIHEIRHEDNTLALRHVFNLCYPQHRDDQAQFKRITGRAQQLLRQHIPAAMTVKMLLKPLDLPPRLQQVIEKPLARFSERLFLH